MRRLPTISLSIGFAVAFMAIIGPVRGQPVKEPDRSHMTDDPAKFPTVTIHPTGDAGDIKGKLKLTSITLQTEIGSTTIGMEHVRRVVFQRDPEGKSHDAVQLHDKSFVYGIVTAEQFVVDIGSGETIIKKTAVRDMEIHRDVPLAWSAILFGLVALSAMEIVLGIDNVIFLAIVVGRLPKEKQDKARKIGLGAALGTRILLLFSLSFLLTLTTPIFTLPDLPFLHNIDAREVSWRDLILLGGGLFLIAKSVIEVHKKLEESRAEHAASHDSNPDSSPPTAKTASFAWTIVTIAIIDIVFSLDSVITAIGMVEQVWVMVVAMVIAMAVMLYFAGPIGRFVERHPTVKILALSFLILIGVMLVAEGMGQHMDKGYIYAAMAFAVVVEMINMQLRRSPKKKPAEAPPPLPA